MKYFRFTLILVALLTIFVTKTKAQDFIYTPTNPAFGGNTYNYTWMLSSAAAQNDFEESYDSYDLLEEDDPLAAIKESINDAVIDEITQRVITQQLGESGLDNGTYTIGDYKVDVGQSSQGVVIDIQDITNGSSAQVIVPNF